MHDAVLFVLTKPLSETGGASILRRQTIVLLFRQSSIQYLFSSLSPVKRNKTDQTSCGLSGVKDPPW